MTQKGGIYSYTFPFNDKEIVKELRPIRHNKKMTKSWHITNNLHKKKTLKIIILKYIAHAKIQIFESLLLLQPLKTPYFSFKNTLYHL